MSEFNLRPKSPHLTVTFIGGFYKWGEPNRRTPETDSPNPWGSIEPSLRTTALDPSQTFHTTLSHPDQFQDPLDNHPNPFAPI